MGNCIQRISEKLYDTKRAIVKLIQHVLILSFQDTGC